jgi:hypothetical protein
MNRRGSVSRGDVSTGMDGLGQGQRSGFVFDPITALDASMSFDSSSPPHGNGGAGALRRRSDSSCSTTYPGMFTVSRTASESVR